MSRSTGFRLSFGDRVPPYLGVTHQGLMCFSEEQAGRTVVLIMAPDLSDPVLPAIFEAFSERADAFAAFEADVTALTGATSDQVFAFSQAHPGRIILAGGLNDFFKLPDHLAFDSESPAVIVADPNMRVAGRFEDMAPEAMADAALAAIRALPREPGRDVRMAAPVLILPNLVERSLCEELIEMHRTGATFDSSTVALGGDGQTRMSVNPKKKIRRDLLIEADDPMHARLTEIVMRRCAPEIKRAFYMDITHTDIFLVGCYPGGGGHFRRHRDNRPAEVAHRRFALSINLTLDANGYEGGYLRLPEFGPHNYRCAPGAGIIFSVALLHEITPVLSGDRYVLVTHLHDDVGEAHRLAMEREIEAATA
jgi:predicted 2-oxoglutarate/Fe(II)-dependent dioxygenase YbiX